MGRIFHAVQKGRNPGVYTSWKSCKAQIDGFYGAVHKDFDIYVDAEAFSRGIDRPFGHNFGSAQDIFDHFLYDFYSDSNLVRGHRRISCNPSTSATPHVFVEKQFDFLVDRAMKSALEDWKRFKNDVGQQSRKVIVYVHARCSLLAHTKFAVIGVYFGRGSKHNFSRRLPIKIPSMKRPQVLAAIFALRKCKQLCFNEIVIRTRMRYVQELVTHKLTTYKSCNWTHKDIENFTDKMVYTELEELVSELSVRFENDKNCLEGVEEAKRLTQGYYKNGIINL